MSAFVVNDETINKIVDGLVNDENAYYTKKQLTGIGINLDAMQKNDIGLLLFNLNVLGVNERYGEGSIRDLMQRRPGIVSRTGHAKLDEIAQIHGFDDADILLNAILETPSKKDILKELRRKMEACHAAMELRIKGYELTDGLYPESLLIGDYVYMGGDDFIVCGYDNSGLLVLASAKEKIKVDPDNKLLCDGVKRRIYESK